jgi:hypothetical protein
VSEPGRLEASEEPTEAPLGDKLTHEEDDELRRLYYMSQVGSLSPWSKERLLELRIRDRRFTIRRPREMEQKQRASSRDDDRGWKKFISRRG